jgi:hypothetical protein
LIKHTTCCLLSLACSIFLFLGPAVYGQDYAYIQYSTKDGLPSATVHGITQDHTGFLWFATEAGLSRFDGKTFRTYTIADGLPSSEVFFTLCDSRNRIWIGAFKNGLAYYYNGKIYNQDNDPLLRKIKMTSRMLGIAETPEGKLLIHVEHGVYVIPSLPGKDPVFIADDKPAWEKQPAVDFKQGTGLLPLWTLPRALRSNYSFDVNFNNVQHTAARDKQYALFNGHGFMITTVDTAKSDWIPFPDILVHRFYNDSVFIIGNISRGVKFYDFKKNRYIREYLPKRRVQAVFQDKDNNLWFSTKGAGVFRLSRHPFVNYTFGDQERPFAVYQIYPENGQICVVTEKGTYWKFKPLKQPVANEPLPFFYPVRDKVGIHRLKMQAGKLLHFYDAGFRTLVPVLKKGPDPTVKTIFYDRDTILLAASHGVFLYTAGKQQIIDTLFPSRATCALKIKDTVYIGSLEGLFSYYSGKLRYLGTESPSLSARISTIAPGADSMIWVGTYEKGVIGIKNGKVVAVLNKEHSGLSSNVCRCLFLNGNYLWIGTENGINKVDLSAQGPGAVKNYDMTDGLPSDNINAIYVEGSIVYTGSPEGITCFDESKVPVQGSCDILFTDITVGGKTVDPDTGLARTIKHEDNSIRFQYAGLSFVSAGNITYRYRLLGLSNQWHTTDQMYLDYPTLPSGHYKFQIVAINKFGNESALLERDFTIEPLLWERKGIQLLAGGVLMALTGLFFQLKIRSVRKKNKEQQLLQKRMAALEQKALRAQMNPHFIFNCLNSIQHYIVTNDAKGANFYLVKFSALVRSTLDHAAHMYITLSSELDYLSAYLDLEQMQASPAFNYTISLDQDISAEQIMVPNMLIQPFVENAVKHGVSRLAGEGLISVVFRKNNNDPKTMICSITDNGPGINNPGKHHNQARSHKGMAITRERIDILNQMLEEGEITLSIVNAFTNEGQDYGTKVILSIPVRYGSR